MEKGVYHRAYAPISLSAIAHNFDNLKSVHAPEMKAMAVVKADAYGHGALAVARYLEAKADFFGVASFEEAAELRDGGIQKPILILSYTDPSCYLTMLQMGITPTFCSAQEAQSFSKVAKESGYTGKFHVAVDTGMGRIGFSADESGVEAICSISDLPNVQMEGIFSHFARSDEADKTHALSQKEKFDRVLSLLKQKGVDIPIKHISSSAAAIEMDSDYDMCRFGISLYGLYPSEHVNKKAVSLCPAMEVKSHVIAVKTVEKGTGISYGHVYTAPSERTIATVSIGYADGFHRCLTEGGYVLIKGKRAPVTGRVCMDMIMVDVTDIHGVKIGDTVTVLGRDGDEEITAEDFGKMCNSFHYEVLCTFMPRVRRVWQE
jgi:alanine racemase